MCPGPYIHRNFRPFLFTQERISEVFPWVVVMKFMKSESSHSLKTGWFDILLFKQTKVGPNTIKKRRCYLLLIWTGVPIDKVIIKCYYICCMNLFPICRIITYTKRIPIYKNTPKSHIQESPSDSPSSNFSCRNLNLSPP